MAESRGVASSITIIVSNDVGGDPGAFNAGTLNESRAYRILSIDAPPDRICSSINDAVRGCESDFVAVTNGATSVAAGWLDGMVAVARRHGAAAVGARILDPDGRPLKSEGHGRLSLTGHVTAPLNATAKEEPILFPPAYSALIRRSTFLDVGGFDDTFNDVPDIVDLGWRLNMYGEKVFLAPQAVAFGQPIPDASTLADAVRLRLRERDALARIFVNYEDDTLSRTLPVAVSLALLRGLIDSGIDTLTFDWTSVLGETVTIQPHLPAVLLALEDFYTCLTELAARRTRVQDRRRVSDADLSHFFVEDADVRPPSALYEDVARILRREFGVGQAPGRTSKRDAPSVAPANPQSDELHDVGGPPRVSVVVLTALGTTHLPECLSALKAQTYPADRFDIIVVDNASSEDPTAAITALFPDATVIRNRVNLGFVGGNNQGAAAATGDYVAFLNDDTSVNAEWLSALVETAQRRHATAVASCIVDWEGGRVDFVDGAFNFQGKGFQLDYGRPIAQVSMHEKPLLFACGGAMLVDRRTFVEIGGFDQEAFAYYEDVELGWRLGVLGFETWRSPGSIVRHKHHGTSGRWAESPRIRLCERNALRMLFGLLEPSSLQRVLPAALLLSADLALLSTGLSRAADPARPRQRIRSAIGSIRSGGIAAAVTTGRRWAARVWRESRSTSGVASAPDRRALYQSPSGARGSGTQSESIPIGAAAVLSGLYGFLASLPELAERREAIQARRQVADRDILRRFGSHWLHPSGSPHQAEHNQAHQTLVDHFRLAFAEDRSSGKTGPR